MDNLKREYMDVCDRIYLNEGNIKKFGGANKHNGQALKAINQQLEKDYKIKEELEKKLGI